MRKLPITKERFEKSRYFKNKYGTLKYVSESGKLFKTSKGKVLKFLRESCDEEFDRYYERMKKIYRYDSGIHIRLRNNEDGSETIEVTFDDRFNWDDDVMSGKVPLKKDSRLADWIAMLYKNGNRHGWKFDLDIAKDIESPIDGGSNNDYLAKLTLTCKRDEEDGGDAAIFESAGEDLDNPESLVKFIQKLPDGNDYLFEDNGKWVVTNEWICGTFSGRGFEGDTPEEAASKLIDYLNKHVGHRSLVGTQVSKSGWPNAQRVKEFVATPDDEDEKIDESRKFGRKFKESEMGGSLELTSREAYRELGGRSAVNRFVNSINKRLGQWVVVSIDPCIDEENPEDMDFLNVQIEPKYATNKDVPDKLMNKREEAATDQVWEFLNKHGLDFDYEAGGDGEFGPIASYRIRRATDS